MSWKDKVRGLPAISERELQHIVNSGRVVENKVARRMVATLLGVASEGPNAKAQPEPDDVARVASAVEKLMEAPKVRRVPVLLSSEDAKTPWEEVLAKAKDDDRLEMAIEAGHIHPITAYREEPIVAETMKEHLEATLTDEQKREHNAQLDEPGEGRGGPLPSMRERGIEPLTVGSDVALGGKAGASGGVKIRKR